MLLSPAELLSSTQRTNWLSRVASVGCNQPGLLFPLHDSGQAWVRLPLRKTQSLPRRLAPLRAEAPHFQVGQAAGENARRLGMRRKVQRGRLPRPSTHRAGLQGRGFLSLGSRKAGRPAASETGRGAGRMQRASRRDHERGTRSVGTRGGPQLRTRQPRKGLSYCDAPGRPLAGLPTGGRGIPRPDPRGRRGSRPRRSWRGSRVSPTRGGRADAG